ncbi:hypothetical protein ACFL0M_10755 [Thermodesulfobacteriota bacterium]
MRLITEACREAILDANLDKKKINGILTQRPPVSDLHPQYNCLIANELKEGVYIFSNVVCDPQKAHTNLPVEVFFTKEKDKFLPKFRPVE